MLVFGRKVYIQINEIDPLKTAKSICRYYNECSYEDMIIYILMNQCNSIEQSNLELIIAEIRQRKLPYKKDPKFIVGASGNVAFYLYHIIEKLDNRVPRIELNVRFDDQTGFANLAEKVNALYKSLEQRIIHSRLEFIVISVTRNLRRLSNELEILQQRECWRTIESCFPVFEVPFLCIDEPNTLLDKIVNFWVRWPELNNTIGMGGIPGYFYRLFTIKEHWFIKWLCDSSKTKYSIYGALENNIIDDASRERLVIFDEAAFSIINKPSLYEQLRSENKSAVFDFDVDSIFDSRECQSPYFLLE